MKLKGLIIAIGVAGFSTSITVAQIRMDFGAKVGFNVAGLALSSSGKIGGLTYNNRTGYHIGGYASARLGKFAIQPEIIYSKQGQNFTINNSYSNLNNQLNYINIPVMIKYYLVGGLNLQAG